MKHETLVVLPQAQLLPGRSHPPTIPYCLLSYQEEELPQAVHSEEEEQEEQAPPVPKSKRHKTGKNIESTKLAPAKAVAKAKTLEAPVVGLPKLSEKFKRKAGKKSKADKKVAFAAPEVESLLLPPSQPRKNIENIENLRNRLRGGRVVTTTTTSTTLFQNPVRWRFRRMSPNVRCFV